MESDNQNQETDNSDQESEGSAPAAVADWRSNLDPTVKEHPSLKNFKSPGDLAKSWVEAQKLIGRDKIPVPDSTKGTKEDWDMVFDRLGRPKEAKDYSLDEMKMPEGFPAESPEFLDEFKSKAHELGLLPAQVKGLHKWFKDQQVNEFNQYGESKTKQRGEAENALRKQWGKAYEQNFNIAEQAVNKYGSESFINKLKQTGMNNDPDMVMFIADMAKNFSEDRIAGKPVGLTLSPEEAQAEISKIQGEAMKDKDHPMNNKHHPEYEFFLKKWKSLHEQAYPQG